MTGSEQAQEAQKQHMLLVVESAQRAGLTEREISDVVEDAVREDADLDRAA